MRVREAAARKKGLEERVRERKETLATKIMKDIDHEREEEDHAALEKVRVWGGEEVGAVVPPQGNYLWVCDGGVKAGVRSVR
jgi:hypothetical protein